MEYRSSITLEPGDVLDIPGIGSRQIGAIDQMKHDQYLVRLDAKFKPSVTIAVTAMSDGGTPEQHDDPWSPVPSGETQAVAPRIHSRDPEHLRQDLAAALTAALVPEHSAEERAEASSMVESITEYGDTQPILREVLATFGPTVFGSVALFSSMAKTSLAGHAESLTHPNALAEMGCTVGDLAWPRDVLHERYVDQAGPDDTDRDLRLSAAVLAWKTVHDPEVPDIPEASVSSDYAKHKAEITSSLNTMLCAERDWDELPPSLLMLDEAALQWIAAALASEGIGLVG